MTGVDSELNLLMAKILGWEPRDAGNPAPIGWTEWHDGTGMQYSGRLKFDKYIGEAWILVEKLGLWVFPVGGTWFAGRIATLDIDMGMGFINRASFHCLESADTAPEAICKAAKVLYESGLV